MTQASIDRRNMWAERIERRLSSSMSIERWCKLKVKSVCMVGQVQGRRAGPFLRRNAATLNWIELTRGGLANSKAIVPAGTFSDNTAVSSIAHAGQQRHDGNDASDACGDAGQPICAVANGVRIIVPPGSAESDIACALRAAMSL